MDTPSTQSGNKKSFIMYHDFHDTLEKLSNEQAGILFKAIFHWQKTNEIPEIEFALELVLTPIISQFKRDNANYSKICLSRSEAGRLGGLAKAKNASKSKQTLANLANLADNDSDNDSDNDKISLLPAEAVSIADLIIEHVRTLNPNQRNINPPKLKKTRLAWSREIDRANRIDGRTWEDIRSVFVWASSDDFWSKNILSGNKLREKYDDLFIRMNSKKSQELFKAESTFDAEKYGL